MNPLVHTLLPAAVLLSVLPAASQSSNPFAEQVLRYPQEKLHVHTDKDTYVAGDTIWLRARCVDAASHRPVAASRYVYAELRDESGALVRRIKILRRDSLYAGYLPVPTDAPDGDYTFSAYTRFMRNQGADYFFRKPLRIAAYRGAAGEVPKPRPRPATGDFAVTFHPEGGYLVPGRSCRVAFKAPDGCRPFDGCRSRAPRRPGYDARHRADAPCGNGQFPDGSRGGPHLPCGVPHPFGRREALRPPRAECRGVRAATRGTGRIHRGERADGRILARTAAAGGALPGQPLLRRRLGTGIAFPQFRSAGGRGAMAVAGCGGQRPFRTAAVQ